MKKIEPLIYFSEKTTQRSIIDLFAKMNEVIDSVNALMPSESPKPDWVKEEIKEMRPSNDLLRKVAGHFFDVAYKMAQRHADSMTSYDIGDLFRPELERYFQSIPPDTLKEDRELVKSYLPKVLISQNYVQLPTKGSTFGVELIEALKRVLGMEVGNGG